MALLGGSDQGEQHLRQQDQAMRSMRMQGLQEARRIEPPPPLKPIVRIGSNSTRTGHQAGVQPGDVLEQRRQRQHAQMALDRAALADLRDAVRHGELRSRTQAHPLGWPVLPEV